MSVVTYTNGVQSGKELYSYNSVGLVSKIVSYDSTNTIKYSLLVTYNSDKTLSSLSVTPSGLSNTINYQYSGGLISSSSSSYNLSGNTNTTTKTYTYDSNQNLVLMLNVNQISGSFSSKDSTLFSGYVNGRPTIKTVYTSFFNNIQSPMVKSKEEVYDYDANMNRTKVTYTSYSSSGSPIITSVYNSYVSETHSYELGLPLFPASFLNNTDNSNINTKDQNKYTANSSKYYSACPTGNFATYLSDSSSINNASKNPAGCLLSAKLLKASGGTCTKAAQTKTETFVINY